MIIKGKAKGVVGLSCSSVEGQWPWLQQWEPMMTIDCSCSRLWV